VASALKLRRVSVLGGRDGIYSNLFELRHLPLPFRRVGQEATAGRDEQL
jgi:hypothetical protein